MKYVVPWLPVCVVLAGCGSTVAPLGVLSNPADVVSVTSDLIDIRLVAVQSSSQPMWELFSKQISDHQRCPQVRLEWSQLGFATQFRLDYDQSAGTLVVEDGRGSIETHQGVTRSDMQEVQRFLVTHRPRMLDQVVAAKSPSMVETRVECLYWPVRHLSRTGRLSLRWLFELEALA